MGNFHCITSDCATVNYREYLSPLVRWRYEGEDWQEIIGADDYTTVSEPGQCLTTYDLEATVTLASTRFRVCGQTAIVKATFTGSFNSLEEHIPTNQTTSQPRVEFKNLAGSTQYIYLRNTSSQLVFGIDNCAKTGINTYLRDTLELKSIKRRDGNLDDCGDCTFTVYKNNQIVHTEIRNECPEVEILPCRLSDIRKEIKIDKKPWQEKIQVVGEDNRDALFGDFLETIEEFISGNIPNHCREVWKTISLDFFADNFDDFDSSSYASYYQLVSTICSAQNCPPPEYEVICDCQDDCESCPENTCAIECEGSICCYDTATGKSIKSIPITNYCGE